MIVTSGIRIGWIAAAFALIVGPSYCRAGSVSAKLQPYTGNTTVLINSGDGSSPSPNGVHVGAFTWTDATSTGSPALASAFTSFCIQLGVNVYPSTTPYTYDTSVFSGSTPGMTAASADAIAKLWGGFYSQINTYPTPGYGGNVNATVNSAAFQLAIWSLEYGPAFQAAPDPSTDAAEQANAANAISLANTLVKATQDGDFDGVKATNLVALTEPALYHRLGIDYQNQLTAATPEPSTICLGGIGLGMLIAARIRRRKATA